MISNVIYSLMFVWYWIEAAPTPRQGSLVRYSAVPMGSKVSLVGRHHEHAEPCIKAWFKKEYQIPIKNSQKYSFLKDGTILVIHDFSVEDVGCYFFLYSKNMTKEQVIFNLEMIPPQGQHWYEKDSKHVGTVIGMMFLLLIVLALLYYCCSKDVDAVFPTLQLRLFTPPNSLQSNNNENIYSAGVKFASGVHIADNNGRRKTSREVRRESLNMLGFVSKQNIKKKRREKTPKRKRLMLMMGTSPQSSLL